jgi:hypothetical protein
MFSVARLIIEITALKFCVQCDVNMPLGVAKDMNEFNACWIEI